MSAKIPYTYISCPCTDNSRHTIKSTFRRSWGSVPIDAAASDPEDEDKTFDPKAPRSAYSLWPIERLHWCDDCHQIRCPRCVQEEVMIWYCPNCLYEVPQFLVKSEGNRCLRHCYDCPICTSPLSVNSLSGDGGAPFMLGCGYCNWTSLEIGIQFDKSTDITGQLNEAYELLAASHISPTQPKKYDNGSGADDNQSKANGQFASLKAFYTSQITQSSPDPLQGFSADFGSPSPGSLSRILGLYSGAGGFGKRKQKDRLPIMREAHSQEEGLKILGDGEEQIIEKIKTVGWQGTTSVEQRTQQPNEARLTSDLRPVPTLLRTLRSKRCRACRHNLCKPEHKTPWAPRYRIKILAAHYIPHLTLTPLTTTTSAPTPPTTTTILTPLKPTQYLLTVTNPLYAPMHVNLATPTHTAGRFASKITILCPSFDVGANREAWQSSDTASSNKPSTASRKDISGPSVDASEAVAGKIWKAGRNWTSVVVEIVPCSLFKNPTTAPSRGMTREGTDTACLGSLDNGGKRRVGGVETVEDGDGRGGVDVDEDEDVLEMAVFMHASYVDEESGGGGGAANGANGADGGGGGGTIGIDGGGGGGGDGDGGDGVVKREVAYWYILGVGKIERGIN